MMQIPNVCPNCRSTAVRVGVETVRCLVCRWSGRRDDLLGVVSQGLTLEEMLGKFTQDLLAVFVVASEPTLEFFLARWGVVDPTDKRQMHVVTSRIIGRMASGVLQYCTGSDPDAISQDLVDVDGFVERAGTGIARYILDNGLIDFPPGRDGPDRIAEIVGDMMRRLAERIAAELISAAEADREGGCDDPGPGGDV